MGYIIVTENQEEGGDILVNFFVAAIFNFKFSQIRT